MSEIAKCPVCGKAPGWHEFDVECHAPDAERKYFCCGVECKASRWNQYSAAMELAKAVAAYAANIPPGGYSSTKEFDDMHDAEEHVLEVFNG